jgi:hypothetical protein
MGSIDYWPGWKKISRKEVKLVRRIKRFLGSTMLLSAVVALSGCAGFASQFAIQQQPDGASQVAAKPIPRVQDCGVLDTGTPSRFVCGGKVYTAFQLAKLREDEARKYGSGK